MPFLKPSEIRYCQDSIAYYFKRDNKYNFEEKEKCIGETLDDLLLGRTKLDEIPKITVFSRGGFTYTLDNRRLWVFKKLEQLGECEEIEVRFGRMNTKKFTTKNYGTSIRVRPHGDPGGIAWKTWNNDQMSNNPSSEWYGSSIYRDKFFRREKSRYTNEQFEEVLSSFANTRLGPPTNVSRDPVIKINSPRKLAFCQMHNIRYGNNLGERLDDMLLSKAEIITCSLDVFEHRGRYYTRQCDELWLLKTLEKFGKELDIQCTIKDRPAELEQGFSRFCSLYDSLNLSTPIGGVYWRKIENMSKLQTLEEKSVPVSDVYFTVPAISDVYGENSLVNIFEDSFATMTIPRSLRVIEHNGRVYALDNELLWVVKELEKFKGRLLVSVEIKMQMDKALFNSFTVDELSEVDITVTSNRRARTSVRRRKQPLFNSVFCQEKW